jgi:hypothetical protein
VERFDLTASGSNIALSWSGSDDPTVNYSIAVGGATVASGVRGTQYSLNSSICEYVCEECVFTITAESDVGVGPSSSQRHSVEHAGEPREKVALHRIQ